MRGEGRLRLKQSAWPGARSEVHLRLHDERDQLLLFGRDECLPHLGPLAAMDEGRSADHRRAGRRGGDEIGLALDRRRPLGVGGQIDEGGRAPSVSAKLMIAPPWAIPPIVQISGRISIRAERASASALRNSIPSNWAKGSGLALMRSMSDMSLAQVSCRALAGLVRLGIASLRRRAPAQRFPGDARLR